MFFKKLKSWRAFSRVNGRTIEDTVVEGNKITVRYTCRGTHRGEYMGIQPTGKTIEISAIEIHRTEGGRLAESWKLHDTISFLQQLGMEVPPSK